MHDTIEQGLQRYREEMAKYKKLVGGLKGFYESERPLVLSKIHERDLMVFNARLLGMREALGMTKAEKAEIDQTIRF